MLFTTLLVLASLATPQGPPGPQILPPTTRLTPAQVRSMQGLTRSGQGSNSITLGGAFTAGAAGSGMAVSPTRTPGVYRIVLNDPGTGWQESLIIGVPTVQLPQPAPLLVMFHAHNVSEWDCYVNGNAMFEEARSRGWYVISPLGAHQVNFGIPYAQTNIEYALEGLIAQLPIDQNRIYGAGFSMGGCTMMSYAARHHDLARPRFAALANHTGTVSVAFSYYNASNRSTFEHPLLFGGSPTSFPFLYSQSSAIDISVGTNTVDSATDQARNLDHVPVINFYAVNDPLVNAVLATQVLNNWLLQLPGMNATLLTAPVATHSWANIDEVAVLNSMASKTLQTPTDGVHRVLADREDNWFHFYVQQDAPGAFTPFRWNYEAIANRLTIDATQNLASIKVNCASLGLDTAIDLELIMSTTDGSSEVTILTGYAAQPSDVQRAGVSVGTWSWDSLAQTVTLTESDPSVGATWLVRP